MSGSPNLQPSPLDSRKSLLTGQNALLATIVLKNGVGAVSVYLTVFSSSDSTRTVEKSVVLPSASTGESTPVFEPVHGSWPQAAGKNLANPLAQILSVAMMLEHFDLNKEAQLIRKAVDASLDANVRTPEIQVSGGEKYGTAEVGEWIVNYIKNA